MSEGNHGHEVRVLVLGTIIFIVIESLCSCFVRLSQSRCGSVVQVLNLGVLKAGTGLFDLVVS
jgi:hypothetical protein